MKDEIDKHNSEIENEISQLIETKHIEAGQLFFELKSIFGYYDPYIPLKSQMVLSIRKERKSLRGQNYRCVSLLDIDTLIEFLKDIKRVIAHFEEKDQRAKEEIQRQNAITDGAYIPFEVKNAQETQEI